MRSELLGKVIVEELRGTDKWGSTDTSPEILLSAAIEELGEVAHAINHGEGKEVIQQEIAEVMGVLSRLHEMVMGY